eukprot:TRINITY_DN6567_c0_g1_i1.p1 TRINITY_DN6567_c0_g1~~TRINITY_DN6567_c0_g1_i1.p1  ORF type:complete len:590 (+),score=116.03 TRINITY_DN6567_c0_g1_i1:205-1770(+)
MPLCTVGYEADSEAPFVDNGIVAARDRVTAIVRTLYYARDAKLNYRVIQPLTDDPYGPARFSDEKESAFNVIPASAASGAVAVTASPSGRFLAVVVRETMTVEIRSVKTGQAMNTSAITGDHLVWHSHLDIFATTRSDANPKRVAIYEVNAQQGKMVPVTSGMDTLMPVRAIFGGRWLGVAYTGDDEHFQFYNWDGQSSVGGLLPQPQDLLWDRGGLHCALVYPKSLAIMHIHQKVFRTLCTVEFAARSVLWWNACLLVDTGRQIVILFPAANPTSVVLCTSEVLPCITELGPPLPPEEQGAMSPTMSSKGSRMGGFSSRGSAISAADSKIMRAGLDVASVFKRSKPSPEEADMAALLPTPAPCGYPCRQAKNYLPMRPLGLLTLVDVVDVNLYVMDSDRKLHSIFLGTPAVLWRVLAQTGKVDVALEWQTHPNVQAAEMATFLADRGHVHEALRLPIAPLDRVRLAVRHGAHQAAHDAVVALGPSAPPALLFEVLTGLGLQTTEPHLAQKCFTTAAELVG